LVSQVRRSAVSIPANIVEGHKRSSTKDFCHFLNIAETSLEETKYHLLLSKDLIYLKEIPYNELLNLCEEIGKMLNAIQKKLSYSSTRN